MVFLYALLPGLALGVFNAWYWHRRGYKAAGPLILGGIIFYALSYKVLDYFLS